MVVIQVGGHYILKHHGKKEKQDGWELTFKKTNQCQKILLTCA